jgi:hypothetical protein
MKRALVALALLTAGTTYYTIVQAEDYGVAGEAMGKRAHLALPTAGSLRTDSGLQELYFLGVVSLSVDEALTATGANVFTLEGQLEARLAAGGLKFSDVQDLPPEALSVQVQAAQHGDMYAGATVLTVTQPAYLERTSRGSGAIFVKQNATYVGSHAFAASADGVPAAIEASITTVVDAFVAQWREDNQR